MLYRKVEWDTARDWGPGTYFAVPEAAWPDDTDPAAIFVEDDARSARLDQAAALLRQAAAALEFQYRGQDGPPYLARQIAAFLAADQDKEA